MAGGALQQQAYKVRVIQIATPMTRYQNGWRLQADVRQLCLAFCSFAKEVGFDLFAIETQVPRQE